MAAKKFAVVISGDAKGAQNAFNDAGQSADQMSVGMDRNSAFAAGAFAALGAAAATLALDVAKAFGQMVVDGGKAIVDLGNDFHAAYADIRVGTGATGIVLDELNASFRTVAEDVPFGMEEVSEAIGGLNTRLGATGQPLEDISTQFLYLSKLTGSDLSQNIIDTTRVFGDWGIAAEDQIATTDKLFRAWQASGVPLEQLQTQVVQFGAPMRELGFGFDETLSILAKFNKEGVNTELVVGGMKQSIGRLAKLGRDPAQEFRDLAASIDEVGLTAENKTKVFELFGARAGIDVAKAMEEGRFEIDAMMAAVESGGDTIVGVAEETEGWTDKLDKLKNRALITLEPIAMKVFGAISSAVEAVTPFIVGITEAFQTGGWEKGLESIGAAFTVLKTLAVDALSNAWATAVEWLQANGPAIAEAAVSALARLYEFGVELQVKLLDALGVVLPMIGDWLIQTAWPYLEANWQGWVDAFLSWFAPLQVKMWESLGRLLQGLGEWFISTGAPFITAKGSEMFISLIQWLAWDFPPLLIEGFFFALGALVEWIETDGASWIADGARGMWNGISNAFGDMLNGIIQMWNNFSITIPALEIAGRTLFEGGTIDTPDLGYFPTQRDSASNTGFKRFAEGGVVFGPTLGMIGEDPSTTPEIVTPEALMRKVVREEAGGGMGGPVYLVLKDGRILAEVVTEATRGRELALR